MARRFRTIAAFAGLWVSLALAQGAAAQQPATPPAQVTIGFVDLIGNPRFDADYAYNMVPVRPLGPAYNGAELGIIDAAQIGRVINVEFTLQHASAADSAAVIAAVRDWAAAGTHFILADLPADVLLQVSDAVTDLPVTIFNVSATADRLRAADCRANVIHTIPSTRMYTDAVVQFLVSKRWRNILVMQGPLPQDQATVDALRVSAGFFGARIVDVRPFTLSADPRNREQNNVALITAGANYDAVFVADADGEFARYVPYLTNDPRPVVGAAGLVAAAWHWSWERSGAPQVNARFEDLTGGRRMDNADFAAWAAVRAITQGALRSQSTEHQPIVDFILGDRMNLDGSKGYPMTFRPWDHQMRQAILLATGNAVIQLAPIEGFLHQTNDLDTLGVDAPQSVCRF